MARGNGNGNGRGRGFRGGRGGGRGRGGYNGGPRGPPGFSFVEEELEFTAKMFADAPPSRGNRTPRGKGRGGRGGQFSGPNSGTSTPNRGRGRGGYDSPRGRGRGHDGIGASPRGGYGRGGDGANFRPNGTLSGLLYQERPLLRPIVFVPSVLTKVLFQEEEELLKPGVEEVDDTDQSHVPTADQVSRVFNGDNVPRMESDSEEDAEDQEEIEEVDFNEVGKLFDDSLSTTKTTTTIRKSKLTETTMVEDRFTGFYVDAKPTPAPEGASLLGVSDIEVHNLAKMVEETLSATDEPENIAMSEPIPPVQKTVPVDTAVEPQVVEKTEEGLFFIDTKPAPVPVEMAPTGQDLRPSAFRDDDEDDIIVYVAPHPRNTLKDDQEKVRAEKKKSITDGPPDTSRFSPYVRAAPLPTGPIASSSSSANPFSPVTPAPVTELPTFSSISFSFSQKNSTTTTTTGTAGTSTPLGKSSAEARLRVPPVSTPRQAKAWKRKRGLPRKNKKGKSSFGAFGAMREEALLHPKDPRKAERRRDDSDLEWGDTDDDEIQQADEVDPRLEELFANINVAKGKAKEEKQSVDEGKGIAKAEDLRLHDAEEEVHGMDIDQDMKMDLGAMQSFVGGLLGANAGRHVTVDDLRDRQVMRVEDEDEDEDEEENTEEEGSSDEDEEEENVFKTEEAMLISETLEFEESESDDEDKDDEQTPRSSFQTRLERLREKARARKPEDASFEDYMDDDDEEDDDDDFDLLYRNATWAERDDTYIQQIQDLLEENDDILTGQNRKTRNKLFRSIRDGTFYDMEESSPAKRNKDKGKDLPPALRAQWDKDRQKKAEFKKARELARLEAASDPLSNNKGGKKGRKAMLAAAKLDPTINVVPNRIVDMSTLVQQIRRFIADVGGPSTMSLPPTNKETRKNIHEMAVAFRLKSVSKGKNDARYTTLTKTTRSGFGADEAKIAKIVRRSGGMGARGDTFVYDKNGKGSARAVMPRHKEGDEVGKAAPKINESNIGFRMLAMMGWSEGFRIGGATGGLEVPLTAIIKNTKLGLGANK